MATTIQTRHTPEELLEITDRPMPELVDGQLVEREPMGQRSDAVAARILRFVGNHVDDHQLGLVNGSQGSYQIFPDDPDKVRIPDVSFTSRQRLPQGQVAEGHSRVAPDLVVEVLSPNDKAIDVGVKVREFLSAGVRLIWVANPYSCDIQVYRGDGTFALLKVGDVWDGDEVLPSFRCPVEKIFTI
jgi:Uma2 family endonuclease